MKKDPRKRPSVTPELIRMGFSLDVGTASEQNESRCVIRRLCKCYESKPHIATRNKSDECRPQLLQYKTLFFCLCFHISSVFLLKAKGMETCNYFN